MTYFQINHDDAQDFTPIPVGSYEAIISSVEVKTASSGNKMLSLVHTIRDDVSQEAKKRKVFDNLVVTEKAMFRFQNIAKATAMPNGASFDSEEALLNGFAKHLKGKPLRITIKHDNNRTTFIEQVAGYAPSEEAGTNPLPSSNPFEAQGSLQNGAQGAGAPPWADGTAPNISDDDLPF